MMDLSPKRKTVAQAANDIEREVLWYLEEQNGAHVPMLEIFDQVSTLGSPAEPVTLNFFNTLLGSMRVLGAIEIDKINKTVTITEAGLDLIHTGKWSQREAGSASKAGV